MLGRKTHFDWGVQRGVVVVRGAVRTGAATVVVRGAVGATVVVGGGTGAGGDEGAAAGATLDGAALVESSVEGVEPEGAVTGLGSFDGAPHMLTVTAIAATHRAVAAAIASTRPVNPPMRAEPDLSTRWVMPSTRPGRSRARRTMSQSCPHPRSPGRLSER